MKSSIPACSGILLLDKPQELTSNDAVREVKKLYQERKVGHSGSLDPMATGMLVVCLGEATKFSSSLLSADKVYRFTVTLGVRTDTGDARGEVTQRREVRVAAGRLEQALDSFRGAIEQVPPMYSALKHQGERLYKIARQGREVERKPRIITVHSLLTKEFSPPHIQLEMRCSKGTYVRTVADDLGQMLGCGAHVSRLRRLEVTPFAEQQMLTLDQIRRQELPDRRQGLLPCDAHLGQIPLLEVSSAVAQRLISGMAVPLREDIAAGPVRMYWRKRGFMGLGEATADGMVNPKRIVRFLGEVENAGQDRLQTRAAYSQQKNLAGEDKWR